MPDESDDMRTKTLLSCGAVGGFGFITVALVTGSLRPDYSALHMPVSMLSLNEGGCVQVANFVITGILMLACAIGVKRAVQSGRASKWGPILIGTYGLCLIGAGVFSTDPSYGYPPGAALGRAVSRSLHGRLHDLTSVIVFAALTAACFVFARRFAARPRGRRFAAYSCASGVAIPAFFVSAAVAWSSNSAVSFGGVFQRLSIATGWIWVALLALKLIRDMESAKRGPLAPVSNKGIAPAAKGRLT